MNNPVYKFLTELRETLLGLEYKKHSTPEDLCVEGYIPRDQLENLDVLIKECKEGD